MYALVIKQTAFFQRPRPEMTLGIVFKQNSEIMYLSKKKCVYGTIRDTETLH